jgi:hypothetical protein
MKTKAQVLLEQTKNMKKLPREVKSKINKDLTKMTSGNKYFDSIPLEDIFDILKKYGVTILMEDQTRWSGFLAGADARDTFDLGYIESKDANKRHIVIDNSSLVMSWHKMPSGRYEIVAYVG